jgi:hypothetical protein
MNQSYPVPPPELLEQWSTEANRQDCVSYTKSIAINAAQWGADQELEACCEWLGYAPVVYNNNDDLHPGSYLRDARRPKPPTLKEQALERLELAKKYVDVEPIRRALEALDG